MKKTRSILLSALRKLITQEPELSTNAHMRRILGAPQVSAKPNCRIKE